ncbi:phenylacetic acid degradation protein PaaN [Algihabitans albus]|uniref:phenylacetic acid degradation protein PaaN n=1 Tax=Algihabitans albus TaxID=2164067 RepID=UPI000E5D004C|nr:phenylacetic acid degradation protein PaaN [Algihabitans albus]
MADFFAAHRETLDRALQAVSVRDYWSPYPEVPSGKVYGETAKADGEAAFKAALDSKFDLHQPTDGRWIGSEISPYGFALGTTYPAADVEQLIEASEAARPAWAAAPVETRIGVALEVLQRLNKRSFEIANAVMHTSGQAFLMAFQAGGAHAQDRGLEAVAYAYEELRKIPGAVLWEKPQGKNPPLQLDKTFRIVPRGVALVIGCSTFPTWNSYPGFFASLVTGNSVIVKPHPGAVLPLALTVRIARKVLSEAGFDPNVVLLAVDTADAPIAQTLALRPEVGIIDYTGGPAFGGWLEEQARGKQLFTEQAGVNSVVVESTDNFKGLCGNLAFSLSLYSGQMCTAPQDIFVPAEGIETDQGHKSFDEVCDGLSLALEKLLGDPDRAAAVLGAIQNEATLQRIEDSKGFGTVVRASAQVAHPQFEKARMATPLLLKVEAAASEAYAEECFGPIAFVVATPDAEAGLTRAAALAKTKGAITAGVHSTDETFLAKAEQAFAEAGVSLSENLTGQILVNQSAAFSDYHVSGANPAGNACLTDAAFVANRFRVVAVRRPHAA